MKRFHLVFLLISAMLLMMTTPSRGQGDDKKTLVFQLPDTYKWTSDSFEDGDLWGVHYKGFIGDERYPSVDFQQVSMLNQLVEMGIPKLAKQIGALIKSYDDTAKLQLRKKDKIDGDNCHFYTITTAKTTLLLFYRQSNEVTHSVEMELHADQLEQITLAMWEKLFFSSLLSD